MHKILLQFSLLLLCFAIGFTVSAEPELKGSPAEIAAHLAAMPLIEPQNTVTLTGRAVRSLSAGSGRVLLSVITEHARFQEALQENREIRQQLVSDLVKAEIGQEQILESNLSSTPQYGVFGDKPKQYRIENALRVTITREDEFQHVAQQVDRFDEVFYRELEFLYPNKAEKEQELLAAALEDLRQKKQLYEKNLSVTLTLKTFNEGSVQEHLPLAGTEQRKRLWDEYSSRSDSENVAPIATFGELMVEAGVIAEYVIEHP